MLRLLLLALAGVSLAGMPRAGTAVQMGIGELLGRSDLCLEGRILGARGVLEVGKRIDTEYTVGVDRTFWGESQAVRAIRIPGGVLPDGRGLAIPGLPRMVVGESVVLFLAKADSSGMRMPVGLAQGRLKIVVDARGQKRITRDSTGLTLLDPGTGLPVAVETEPALGYVETIAEIESAARLRRIEESARPAPGRGGR
jgi:hypothetical protein